MWWYIHSRETRGTRHVTCGATVAGGYRCGALTAQAFPARQWSPVPPAICAADVLRDQLLKILDGAAPMPDETIVIVPLCDAHVARFVAASTATATATAKVTARVTTKVARRFAVQTRSTTTNFGGVGVGADNGSDFGSCGNGGGGGGGGGDGGGDGEKYLLLHRDARPQLCACRLTSLPEPLFATAPEPTNTLGAVADAAATTSSYFAASLGGCS